MTRVYLGLGSNLGDRAANLEFARTELARAGLVVVAASNVEETGPVGPVEQPDFLNQVIEVATDLEVGQLLDLAKGIEAHAGRDPQGVRWGPRVLDIDILLFGDEVLDGPRLRVPHPELEARAFVLRELLEIAPEATHPATGELLRDVLRRLE